MYFQRIPPIAALSGIIECYWIAEDENTACEQQKIIPDGFPEIIFHLGDAYRINLSGKWETQSKNLLAGQIRKFFFLENTGASSMVGIKFRPTALSHLYGISMNELTDDVVDVHEALNDAFLEVEQSLRKAVSPEEKAAVLNTYFTTVLAHVVINRNPADRAVDLILEKHGMVTVSEMCETTGVGERQLQNLFKKYVGLSPKYFAQIIRFSYIFELVQQNNQSWSDLSYHAAYYDQSHFIRNFRNFTGENPGDYSFLEENMANFFLKKSD